MEENERFTLFGEHCIKDNSPDACCQLLNAYVACVILNEQDKENKQLKQQLARTEKALELACKEELREFGVYDEDYGSEQKLLSLIEDYKQQAKEMLENE